MELVMLKRILESPFCYQLSAKVEPDATKNRGSPSCLISRGALAPACQSLSGPSGQREWAFLHVGMQDSSFYGKPERECRNMVGGVERVGPRNEPRLKNNKTRDLNGIIPKSK